MAHPEDKTKLTLLYGNYFEDDILCRDELMYYSGTRDNVKSFITLNNVRDDDEDDDDDDVGVVVVVVVHHLY